MITQNFKNLLASVFTANANYGTNGMLPVVSAGGKTMFIVDATFTNYFPAAFSATPTLSKADAGISFGTGGTQPTPGDFNLENTITSGISATVTSNIRSVVSPGILKYDFKISVTNLGSDPITIREIGYKQYIRGSQIPAETVSSGTASSYACLIDRTVFETPITIQPGDAGIIDYTIQTVPATRIKNGINLVSFTYGTDEEICAMIDGARQGLIDLQSDGGWRVGDARTIHLDAWVGGNNQSHVAQDREIVISQFGDYNSCGCLFQFDFLNCIQESQRFNPTNNNNNYGTSEMYTTTLPAMVQALPTWLQDRLKTFDVLVAESGTSSTILTVPNNKLALRSIVEVIGDNNITWPGEGAQVLRYSQSNQPAKKIHDRFGTSSNEVYWWTRSPGNAGNSYIITLNGWITNTYNLNSTFYLSPFGCI